ARVQGNVLMRRAVGAVLAHVAGKETGAFEGETAVRQRFLAVSHVGAAIGVGAAQIAAVRVAVILMGENHFPGMQACLFHGLRFPLTNLFNITNKPGEGKKIRQVPENTRDRNHPGQNERAGCYGPALPDGTPSIFETSSTASEKKSVEDSRISKIRIAVKFYMLNQRE